MRSTLLLFAFAFAVGACSSPPRDMPEEDLPTVPLDEPFTVELGEQVALGDEGIVLRFDAVSSDNRCPADVSCIQAGEAVAQLTLLEDEGPDLPFTLTADGLVIELPAPEQVQFKPVGRFSVALYLLQPYPGVAEQQGMPVTATLEVRRTVR